MPIEGCKMEIADNLSSTNFAASVHTGGGGCQPCWRVTHHQRLLFTGAWRAIFSFHWSNTGAPEGTTSQHYRTW